MSWDKTKPVTNSPLLSAEIRANWDALDTLLVAPVTALANGQVLVKAAGPVLAGVPAGTNGYVLTLVAGVPTWVALPVDPGFTNPMTTLGDLIRAAAAGALLRLGIGASGQVLTVVGGVPAWAALPVDPGFANPMTTAGDLIVGGAAGAPDRLAAGTAGQVLTLASGTPTWAAPTGGGGGAATVLDLAYARFPDGTAGNLFPQPTERVSTGTPATGVPKLVELTYAFDATAVEWLLWKGLVPAGYASTVTVVVKWSMLTATSGNIKIQAALGCVVDGSGDARALVTPAPTVSADLRGPRHARAANRDAAHADGPHERGGGPEVRPRALSLYAGGASSATGDRVLETAALEFA